MTQLGRVCVGVKGGNNLEQYFSHPWVYLHIGSHLTPQTPTHSPALTAEHFYYYTLSCCCAILCLLLFVCHMFYLSAFMFIWFSDIQLQYKEFYRVNQKSTSPIDKKMAIKPVEQSDQLQRSSKNIYLQWFLGTKRRQTSIMLRHLEMLDCFFFFFGLGPEYSSNRYNQGDYILYSDNMSTASLGRYT